MSNRDVRAACAARQCMMNDIEDFDDAIDFQSEKVHSIVRILIPDGMAWAITWAQAFAKSFFDEAYTGEPFDDIELAKDMVGEFLTGIIIDNDPMLYLDFCGVCGDGDPVTSLSNTTGPTMAAPQPLRRRLRPLSVPRRHPQIRLQGRSHPQD